MIASKLAGRLLRSRPVFWVFYEIGKSNLLISQAENPTESIAMGKRDANNHFLNKYAQFQSVYTTTDGEHYPGLSLIDVEVKYQEYIRNYFYCGTGLQYEALSLNLENHQKNKNYALAYNIELKRLLASNESI